MKSRNKFILRRTSWATLALAILPSSLALADNWLSNSGGNWSDGTQWSAGSPASASGSAVNDTSLFSLGASTPYTVTLDTISP